MTMLKVSFGKAAAMLLITASLSAQNSQQLNVLAGTQLASGLSLGINTSGGLTNWLTQEPPPPTPGDLKMVCPAAQAWCAMFITNGQSLSTFPRPGLDLSMYQTLIVEITGDPGTTIAIGIKDATQPDDGTETKVTLPVAGNWVVHSIPLSSFVRANLKNIYVPCVLVFAGGVLAQTEKVRTISYSTLPAVPVSSRSGVLSHIAAGGGWVTVITLVNTSSTAVPVTVGFHNDDGSALSLPVTASYQGATQAIITASVGATINPNATLLITTGQLASTVVGWADVSSTGPPVDGFAIFRTSSPNSPVSEGTVPLQTQFPSTITLPYDNSVGFVMGVALTNLATTSASITATIWDDSGNQLGTQTITVPGNGHTSFVLPTQISLTAGNRGIVQFQSAATGGIAGLGLRFSPYGTFTSVPAIY